MNLDLNILNKYISEGLVVKNDHPTLPISIYNYSRTCQYENKWDEITKMCRGLILDQEGNVIAKGFNKFFNMEEHQPEEIPNETFEVFEKLDGSLGILFWYQGHGKSKPKINDRCVSSFDSDLKYSCYFFYFKAWLPKLY